MLRFFCACIVRTCLAFTQKTLAFLYIKKARIKTALYKIFEFFQILRLSKL